MDIRNARYRELLRKERAFNDIKFFLEMAQTDETINEKGLINHIKFLVGVESEGNTCENKN